MTFLAAARITGSAAWDKARERALAPQSPMTVSRDRRFGDPTKAVRLSVLERVQRPSQGISNSTWPPAISEPP